MTSGYPTAAPMAAVVSAADGVRFVAVARDAADLISQLADYVCARCNDALWPPAAHEVRRLLSNGLPRAAIQLYFTCVGERWDREHLQLTAGADTHRILDPENGNALV